MARRKCSAMCSRFRQCLRAKPVGVDQSGDEGEAEEHRDYDSLYFPPGCFWPSSFRGESSGAQQLAIPAPCAEPAGAFQRRGPKNQKHCWDEADSSKVLVRGTRYLSNQVKEPSQPAMLELVGVDFFKTANAISHYAECPHTVLTRLRQQGDGRHFILLNLGMQPTQLVLIWAVPVDAKWSTDPAGLLFQDFCRTADAKARSDRLKLLPKVVDGPWLIKQMVPSRPVLIGRQCDTKFFIGDRHLEVSVDCSSASIGGTLAKTLTDGSSVVELHCILEGTREEELPERVMGAVAIYHGCAAKLQQR